MGFLNLGTLKFFFSSSLITFSVRTSLGSIFDLSPGRCLVVLNTQFLRRIIQFLLRSKHVLIKKNESVNTVGKDNPQLF